MTVADQSDAAAVYVHVLGDADLGLQTRADRSIPMQGIEEALAAFDRAHDGGDDVAAQAAREQLRDLLWKPAPSQTSQQSDRSPLATLLSRSETPQAVALLLVATTGDRGATAPIGELIAQALQRVPDLYGMDLSAASVRVVGIDSLGIVGAFAAVTDAVTTAFPPPDAGSASPALGAVHSFGTGATQLVIGSLLACLSAFPRVQVCNVAVTAGAWVDLGLDLDLEPWLRRRRLFAELADLSSELGLDDEAKAQLRVLGDRQAFLTRPQASAEEVLFDLIARRSFRSILLIRSWMEERYDALGGRWRADRPDRQATLGQEIGAVRAVPPGRRTEAERWLLARRAYNQWPTDDHDRHVVRPLSVYRSLKLRDDEAQFRRTERDPRMKDPRTQEWVSWPATPTGNLLVLRCAGRGENREFQDALAASSTRAALCRGIYDVQDDHAPHLDQLAWHHVVVVTDEVKDLVGDTAVTVMTTPDGRDLRSDITDTVSRLGLMEGSSVVDGVVALVAPGAQSMNLGMVTAAAEIALLTGCPLLVGAIRNVGTGSQVDIEQRLVPMLPGWDASLLRVARRHLLDLDLNVAGSALRAAGARYHGLADRADALMRDMTRSLWNAPGQAPHTRAERVSAAADRVGLVTHVLGDSDPWFAIVTSHALVEQALTISRSWNDQRLVGLPNWDTPPLVWLRRVRNETPITHPGEDELSILVSDITRQQHTSAVSLLATVEAKLRDAARVERAPDRGNQLLRSWQELRDAVDQALAATSQL